MYCVKSIFNVIQKSQKKVAQIQNLNSTFNNSFVYQSLRSLSTHDVSDELIQTICKGNHELERKLRILMLEVEVSRQDGRCAPNNLNSNHWEHLMSLGSRNQRNNYLTFLWKTEKARENDKAKKELKRKERESMKPEESKEFPDDILYGLQHQSLFLRIRDQSINNFDNYRALQAMLHGQKLIIDCSYEDYMVHRETLNAAKQMTYVFGENRLHKDPFDIHMCNVNMNGQFMKQLRKNIPSLDEPWFPLNFHTESYLNVFPKEKLVYLTPHCREELSRYDHDAIYIVGCMVDKVNNEPLSLAKAKRDGIKMAKLPLDRFLEWAPGAKKNLNINHMIPILLDLMSTGDWEYALRHIPRRKLMLTKILSMQKKVKNPTLRRTIFENFSKSASYYKTHKTNRANSKRSLYDDDI